MSDDERVVNRQRSHDSRDFAEAGPDECPAIHGGSAGYWRCELARGDAGWHSDTQDDGRVWMWRATEEISGCIPEDDEGLTGHFESGDCTHG